MKKTFLIILLIVPLAVLNAQPTSFSGGWPGGEISVDFSKYKGTGGGKDGSPERYPTEKGTSPYKPSEVIIGEVYNSKAAHAYTKAVEAWNKKDWDAVIRHCNTAHAYNEHNKTYTTTREEAKGNKEWDKGVEEANNGNYDKAIDRFKKSLDYFPDNAALKTNITICSRNKISDEAEKCYKKKDWINAAVYYNVLWKNFENNNAAVQTMYSECLSKMENMKKTDQAHIKFDSKLAEVKKELAARNIHW